VSLGALILTRTAGACAVADTDPTKAQRAKSYHLYVKLITDSLTELLVKGGHRA
jgi:hypothetical protein